VSPTAIALTGFIAWSLLLLVVMETVRVHLVLTGRIPSNEFRPDNSNLSGFMQRLARAHANCVEGLPIFGGLLAVALMTRRTEVTDPFALLLLGARVVQSSIHLASVSVMAVNLRFSAFLVQIALGIYFSYVLLLG
jgi:uncharacterized MAPEG superfamily protein